MNYLEKYAQWCANVQDEGLLAEITGIDDQEIRERFTMDLEFGTGGLRGIIGAGSSRMNYYTVGRATQGLADYINAHGGHAIAISYDSRHMSREFALHSALIMAANHIRAYLYDTLMPTPALSFAVRNLGCDAGIMITASHNPSKYNGYKVYGPDGCQMTLEASKETEDYINRTDPFTGVRKMEEAAAREQGLLVDIPDSVKEAFLDAVEAQSISSAKGLKVIYTPLNGTGNIPVHRILERVEAEVTVVPAQELPDGDFPTCPYPNPEERAAMAEALKLCEKLQPDMALATDPDCDRIGIAVRGKDGEYHLMTGNEVGVLLLDFILSQRKVLGTLPEKPVAVKTIVSTALAYPIAREYDAQIIDVLTGFKFIGEQIALLEQKGETQRFVLGFEESYGYLAGTHSRDKDGVVASMLICECAAYHKKNGKTLQDVMEGLYQKYGYILNSLLNVACEGLDGMARIGRIMDFFRGYEKDFLGMKVLSFADYSKGIVLDKVTGETKPTGLPISNVLVFKLERGCEVICRPSGTEPKIKFYFTFTGKTRKDSEELGTALKAFVKALIDAVE